MKYAELCEHDKLEGHLAESDDRSGIYWECGGGRILDGCGHEDLIEAIRTWAQAYPIEAFPEPDHKATGHDPTLCSASMGRHVISRLMELISNE